MLVAALALALIVVGVRTADEVPLDVFPEFAPPIVEIQTEPDFPPHYLSNASAKVDQLRGRVRLLKSSTEKLREDNRREKLDRSRVVFEQRNARELRRSDRRRITFVPRD